MAIYYIRRFFKQERKFKVFLHIIKYKIILSTEVLILDIFAGSNTCDSKI